MKYTDLLDCRLRRRSALSLLTAGLVATVGPDEAKAMLFSGAPVPNSTLPATLTLTNLDGTNSFAQPYATVGFAFGPGDIPVGGSPTLKDSGGTTIAVQMDEVASNHPDGSINQATLTFKMTETISAGASLTYTVGSAAISPNNTPDSSWLASGTPEATLIANQDHKVVVTNFDNGKVYTVSVNDILTNFSGGTTPAWGTSSPAGGWQRYQTGPHMCAWRCWKYLKNDSTGFYEGYRRLDIYIRAPRPTGPYEIECTMLSCNASDAITTTSENYRVSPPRFAYTAVILNGVSTVAYIGGPNDARASTIVNATIDTTNNVINGAYQNVNYNLMGRAVAFQSTGTLPTGISANTTYFPSWVSGNNSGMILCSQRGYAQHTIGSFDNNWAINTAYPLNWFIAANHQSFCCTTAGTSAAAGPGPTGNGNSITDNTAAWAAVYQKLTSQGTGTITMFPVCIAYQSSSVHHCDQNFEPFWSGAGVKPQIVGGQQLSHLFGKSKATLAYASDVTGNDPSGYTLPGQNEMMWPVGFAYLDNTGDGAGDNRIGDICVDQMSGFYLPSSKYYYYQSMQIAFSWFSTWCNLIDERGGHGYVSNNGPNNAGASYTNMPSPQPAFNPPPVKSVAYGVGNWLPFSNTMQDSICNADSFSNQQWIASMAHMPRPWLGAYIRTGRRPLIDMAMRHAAWMTGTRLGRNPVYNSTNYYSVVDGRYPNGQCRDWAWSVSILFNCQWITPSYEPYAAYLTDCCTATMKLHKNLYDPTVGITRPNQRVFGFLSTNNGGITGCFSPWQYYYIQMVFCKIGWQGKFTDVLSFINYHRPFWNLYAGVGVFAIASYDNFYGTTDAEANWPAYYDYCFTNATEFLQTSGAASLTCGVTVGATGTVSISGTTMTVTGSSGVLTIGDLVTGAGIAANTFINSGGPGGDGTYGVSVSNSVSGVSATIKSKIVQVNTVSGTGFLCAWQSLGGVLGGLNMTWKRLSSTGNTGTMILSDSSGVDISSGFYQQLSGSATAAMQIGGQVTYPGSTQPFIADGVNGGSLNTQGYPQANNNVANEARGAMKMMSLCLPGDSALATQLAALTTTIKGCTGISTQGGITWTGAQGLYAKYAIY